MLIVSSIQQGETIAKNLILSKDSINLTNQIKYKVLNLTLIY
jgi:hypothetical protein